MPEREPSSSSRSSLWPLALLGILVSFIALFSRSKSADHQIESMPPHEQAARESNGAPRESAIVANAVPSPEHSTKTQCRPDQTPWWKITFETIAILGGLGLLKVNLDQSRATQQAANAATQSSDTAIETMRLDQRPWMYARIIQGVRVADGKPIIAPLQLINTGKTPAEKVSVDVAVYPVDKGESPVLDYGPKRTHYHLPGGSMFPNIPFPPTPLPLSAARHDEQGRPEIIIATKTMHALIGSGKAQVLVHGRIDYCDIFMIPHSATFCTYATGAPIGVGEDSCTDYNANDNNTTPDPKRCPVIQP